MVCRNNWLQKQSTVPGLCEHVNKIMGYIKGGNAFAVRITDLLKNTAYQTSVTIKVNVVGGAPQNQQALRTVGFNDEEW